METSIIDAYKMFSHNSINAYNNAFLKYLYNGDSFLNSSIYLSIENVVVDYLEHINTYYSLDEVFTFIQNNIKSFDKQKDDADFIKNFRLLSNSIFIAIELHRANSIVDCSCSFEDILLRIYEKYANQFEKEVIELFNRNLPLLKKEFSKRRKIILKIIEHYDNFNIDYSVLELKNNITLDRWFQIFPTYNIRQLKLVGNKKVQNIIEEQKLIRNIIFILIDKINYQYLRCRLNNGKLSNYIIYLPKDFLKTKTNVKKIISLVKNNKSIVLEMDYEEIRKYSSSIDLILSKKIAIMAKNVPRKYDSDLVSKINYLSLDKNNLSDKKLMDSINRFKIPCVLTRSTFDDDLPNDENFYLIRISNSNLVDRNDIVW